MVSVLASSQTKDYNIGICCFSAKHAAPRRMSKNWLARNVYLRTVVSVSQPYKNQTQRVVLSMI